jgi:FtsH-binding integral membrane protein
MRESTKTGLGGTFVMCFVIGLILFLLETRHTGEALERFNLVVLWSTISIVGIVLGVVALAALVVLYFPELKKTLKRKIG